MKIRIKIQGILVFLSLTAAVLLSNFLYPRWENAALNKFLTMAGICFIFVGSLIRVAARGQKAESSLNGHVLVTKGFYKFSRNPMYFGTFLIGSGVTLALFEWWALVIFAAVYLAIYIPQIIKEEKVLAKVFGVGYFDYCKKTPRFFPKAVEIIKTDARNYLYFKWSWLRKELQPLIGIICVIIAIKAYKGASWRELLGYLLIIFFVCVVFSFLYRKENEK